MNDNHGEEKKTVKWKSFSWALRYCRCKNFMMVVKSWKNFFFCHQSERFSSIRLGITIIRVKCFIIALAPKKTNLNFLIFRCITKCPQ